MGTALTGPDSVGAGGVLPEVVVHYFRERNLWIDGDVSRSEIQLLNLDKKNTDFVEFYSRINAGAGLFRNGMELLGLVWNIENTTYLEDVAFRRSALKMPSEYVFLDSFEGDGGYIYDSRNGAVVEYDLSASTSSKIVNSWDSFSEFLMFFFEIE